MKGEVFVAFSDNILVLANYSNFNATQLLIEIRDGNGMKVSYNFTWNITSNLILYFNFIAFNNKGFKL